MIDGKTKDKLLKQLIDQNDDLFLKVKYHDIPSDFEMSNRYFDTIIDHFESMNFLKIDRFLGGQYDIYLKVEAFDFYKKGGFQAQELMLMAELEKLDLEIENLKPKFGNDLNKMSSTVSNLLTVAKFFNFD